MHGIRAGQKVGDDHGRFNRSCNLVGQPGDISPMPRHHVAGPDTLRETLDPLRHAEVVEIVYGILKETKIPAGWTHAPNLSVSRIQREISPKRTANESNPEERQD
jgi:hypothetical protein